jgi:hypothetical protein
MTPDRRVAALGPWVRKKAAFVGASLLAKVVNDNAHIQEERIAWALREQARSYKKSSHSVMADWVRAIYSNSHLLLSTLAAMDDYFSSKEL